MQLKPIDQQVVVIMGASSGIGREAALQFAQRGAKLIVSARSDQGLKSLVDEIRRNGGTVTPVIADVADFSQVQAVADEAVARYGRLDTWVHLAAVSLYATFEETTPEEFKRVIEINLLGQIYGAKAALPHLKREGRGALIHVSSIESQLAFPYQSAYACSKHGIPGFLNALRLELRRDKLPISVTNIMPAAINTPLFNKARTKLGVKPAVPPPVYQPNTVAAQILHAAEHPVRDLVAGGAGKVFITTQQLSPRLMDALLLLGGFGSQRSDEPKSADAPDNLYGPIAGYNRVEGDYGHLALGRSAYNWLTRRPLLQRVLAGSALAALAVASARLIDES
jgi:NAD(P)-dependent dehydrogenase (short-subunit alcohol dehydrogenase family)